MEKKQIGSRQNPVAREAAALGKDAALRRETGRFLCEGARLCRDAARSGLAIETCFFTDAAEEKYAEYLAEILAASRKSFSVSQPVAALLSSTKTTQGVFCVCRRQKALHEGVIGFAPQGHCLVLEDVQDPGNLGTVLRTAEAFGLQNVFLLGNCCDPLSPKALRSSMGAAFRLAFWEERSAEKLCKLLKESGYQLHAAVPGRDARAVTEIDFRRGLHAVFIGNEGNGLRAETVARCDGRITVPMAGRAESLNASAAATVLLWEMAREGGLEHG